MTHWRRHRGEVLTLACDGASPSYSCTMTSGWSANGWSGVARRESAADTSPSHATARHSLTGFALSSVCARPATAERGRHLVGSGWPSRPDCSVPRGGQDAQACVQGQRRLVYDVAMADEILGIPDEPEQTRRNVCGSYFRILHRQAAPVANQRADQHLYHYTSGSGLRRLPSRRPPACGEHVRGGLAHVRRA